MYLVNKSKNQEDTIGFKYFQNNLPTFHLASEHHSIIK